MGVWKKFCLVVIGLCLITCSCWGVADSADQEETLSGSIKAVNGETLVVTFEDPEKMRIFEKIFTIGPETQYDQIGSASDLKEGDTVNISYKEDGDQVIALKIAKAETEEN